MKYWKVAPREAKNQYRCTHKHKAMIAMLQKSKNAGTRYSAYSQADIIELAITTMWEKRFKLKAADFKV